MGAVVSIRFLFQGSKRVAPKPISVVPAPKSRGRNSHKRASNASALPSLMTCIKTGNAANVKACLDAGKDINQVGMWGSTPLICACQYGKEAIALLLLDNGATMTHTNHKGANALLFACLEGLDTVVKRIVLSGNESVETDHATVFNFTNDSYAEHTPISAAAANGHSQIISLLLKRFTWPPAQLADAFNQAILGKHQSCVEMLLRSSSPTTFTKAVPYEYIGIEGMVDVVDLLFRAGFNLTDLEQTLLAACEHDQQYVVNAFVDQGISVEAATKAAFICCRFHSQGCWSELSSSHNGADLTAKNEQGQMLSDVISQTFQ